MTARQNASQRSTSRPDADRWSFGAFVAVIALAPIWYGAAGEAAQLLLATALGLVLATYAAGKGLAGEAFPIPLRMIAPAAGLYAAATLYAVVQAVPWTPDSWHNDIWALAAQRLGDDLPGAISLNPAATWIGVIRLCSFAAAFWLALQFGRNPERARFTLFLLVVTGAACSVYGLIEVLSGHYYVLAHPQDPYGLANYGAAVSGTYVNHNHFATQVGISLLAAGCLLVREFLHASPQATRARRTQTLRVGYRMMTRALPVLGCSLILVPSLFLSESRGGLLATAAGGAMLLTLYALRARQRLVIGLVLVATMVAAALLFMLFGEPILRRTASQSDVFSGRLELYRLIINAILDNPWLGFGYGAFQDFFPIYRDLSAGIGGVWNAAHNTYLEVLSTLGVPAGSALILSGFICFGWCARAALRRRRHAVAPVAAASACVLLGVHSLYDFPIQLDGIALTFATLLGVGVAQSFPEDATASIDPDMP